MMIVIKGAGWVAAPVEDVWEVVRRVEELPSWLAGVRRADARGPQGHGRVQRTYGSRPGSRGGVDVEAEVIAYREPTLIAWRNVARRVGGGAWLPTRPDELHLQLEPEQARTMIRLYAVRQVRLAGSLLLRLGGAWPVRDDFARSVAALDARLNPRPAG